MSSELCSTCGAPMSGHICPMLPEGVVRKGSAIIKAYELRKTPECPHCGRPGGHCNDKWTVTSWRCAAYQYSRDVAGLPADTYVEFSPDLLRKVADWLEASGASYSTKVVKPRVERPEKPKRVKMAPPEETTPAHEPLVVLAKATEVSTVPSVSPEGEAPATEGVSTKPPKADVKRLKALLSGKAS